MTDVSMAELARRWSELLIADLLPPERLTAAAEASGSLLREPATEDEIRAAEARLGRRLPASYREFLQITNGAYGDDYGASLRHGDLAEGPGGESDVIGVGFLPVQDVGWLRNVYPRSAEAFSTMDEFGAAEPVETDGAEPDNWTPMADGLLIATEKGPGTTVLIPFAQPSDSDAEWQLWNVHYDTATGYLSFRSFLEREVALRQPLHADLAALRELIDGPVETWRQRFEKLRLVDSPSAVPLLIWALNRPSQEPTVDANPSVPDQASRARSSIAMAAGIALGRIQTDLAVDALVAADRNLAKQGLKRARTPAALDALAAAGDFQTLHEVGDPRAAAIAAENMPTAGSFARGHLAHIVARSRDRGYIPMLQHAYDECTTDQDRLGVAVALAMLGSGDGVAHLRRLADGGGGYAISAQNNLRLHGWA